jgi:cellulose synthase/poly-beta-1,6-N-acetylglucosamine synthase-like glycosyltransferase
MQSVSTPLLMILIILFGYPFLIYPLVIMLWARRQKRVSENFQPDYFPDVAMVICALNEQGVIGEKISNALALDYPPEKFTIVVVSDGSTDRTAEIVRSYQSSGVVLVDQKLRRGKIANLNEVIPVRNEEIILLSDANVLYHRDAIKRLIARFADDSIGCVTGKVILTDTTPDLQTSTEQYYSLEWALQKASSAVYSMVGADGAMYALRRELFRPCPNDTLIEDLVIPMHIISKRKRVVFEPRALAWEKGVESIPEEFRRKVRIAAGAAQGLIRGNVWPKNAPARFWYIFLSHKFLRWLSPLTGILLVITALFTRQSLVAKVVLWFMAVVVLLALLRTITGWRNALFTAPFYFLFGQIAMAIGLFKGISGTQTVLWKKINR